MQRRAVASAATALPRKESSMKFIIRRLRPRPALVALGILAGALSLLTGGQPASIAAAPADSHQFEASPASCAAGCTIDVAFNYLQFTKLDDCGFGEICSYDEPTIQAYGNFTAATWKAGVFGPIKKLKLASWGNQPGSCPIGVSWTDPAYSHAPCYRLVSEAAEAPSNDPYSNIVNLADTYLCSATTNAVCNGPWQKQHNHLKLTVKPGELIMVSTLIYDYDSASADDVVCSASRAFGPFTAAQLASLDTGATLSMPFNGDGGCALGVTVKQAN